MARRRAISGRGRPSGLAQQFVAGATTRRVYPQKTETSAKVPAAAKRASRAKPPHLDDLRIAVIGLGYVGLPLAAYLARRYPVMGFDISERRVADLRRGIDRTRELTQAEMTEAGGLTYTSRPQDLAACNFYIVTVPTPIDNAKRPDVRALERASETVGKVIGRGDVVVYESTVYPGATEEICVPIIERVSGLRFNKDFFAGYSPERINPGDATHRLPDIAKITSGSTKAAADLIDKVYASIITAPTHRASSIRVAEAAKVIENIQRDVNIALINELALLFKRLGLETREVLAAAGSKWNFHPYTPGLVGGHCIGVDPYYLTHKAQAIGFHPEMILAGRRINDGMATCVVQDILRLLVQRRLRVDNARLLVMGFSFKENCPDTRNTKVADLVQELKGFVGQVDVYDPVADADEARHEYGIEIVPKIPRGRYHGIILAVRHKEIVTLGATRMRRMLVPNGVIYDLKGVLALDESDGRL